MYHTQCGMLDHTCRRVVYTSFDKSRLWFEDKSHHLCEYNACERTSRSIFHIPHGMRVTHVVPVDGQMDHFLIRMISLSDTELATIVILPDELVSSFQIPLSWEPLYVCLLTEHGKVKWSFVEKKEHQLCVALNSDLIEIVSSTALETDWSAKTFGRHGPNLLYVPTGSNCVHRHSIVHIISVHRDCCTFLDEHGYIHRWVASDSVPTMVYGLTSYPGDCTLQEFVHTYRHLFSATVYVCFRAGLVYATYDQGITWSSQADVPIDTDVSLVHLDASNCLVWYKPTTDETTVCCLPFHRALLGKYQEYDHGVLCHHDTVWYYPDLTLKRVDMHNHCHRDQDVPAQSQPTTHSTAERVLTPDTTTANVTLCQDQTLIIQKVSSSVPPTHRRSNISQWSWVVVFILLLVIFTLSRWKSTRPTSSVKR